MDVVQFSLDILADRNDIDAEKIAEALESLGYSVLGASWKASWTQDDYEHGKLPYSYD